MSGTGAASDLGRLKRFEVLDQRAVNLDGFASEDPDLGLAALRSPHDPDPSLAFDATGRIVELDGTAAEGFDIIDWFISRHGIDTSVAAEAMAIPDFDIARMLVDPSVSREDIARLARGMTPAKLARVVGALRPAELMITITKMRVRRTPSIQAHVTNRLDDPMLLAADAAAAVAMGFRELETTVPVLGDAPSNAVALLIGSQVGRPGALTQCSIEEALELELGMRGLTTYAETVSLYGTEQVFVDGDDTPWSKAFLCSAYASRGLKMRVTSGAGAEVLMGEAERRSMLYLESRCVSLARAAGAQGVQNGGIDGASVAASVPGGMRELLAENLLVMLHGLESCSGNDTLVSESDLRRAAHTVPLILAGSDFIFSGFGSVPAYDNMFGPSNFNAEDLDDYLVIQRDWDVDGGLRPVTEAELLRLRERAARAVQAVYHDLDLADFDHERLRAVVAAHGSQDLPNGDPLLILGAATAISQRGITAVDVAASLARSGFAEESERVLAMVRERVKGDHLQPAAIFDEQMQVLSKVTDPNDYCGPGTGHDPGQRRLQEISSIRQQRSVASLLAEQSRHSGQLVIDDLGPADAGHDPREVAIGISPALGRELWVTLSGLGVGEVLRQVVAGIEEEGAVSRVVRVPATIDLGMIGLSAARLAGSGIGVGVQAKGTALIHQRGLPPLANLELLSVAPLITCEMYRELGRNAARHAKGVIPAPIRNAYTSQAITARYHARTVAMVAVERQCSSPGTAAVDVHVQWDATRAEE
jgi:propanediol dehydratase large subunit